MFLATRRKAVLLMAYHIGIDEVFKRCSSGKLIQMIIYFAYDPESRPCYIYRVDVL